MFCVSLLYCYFLFKEPKTKRFLKLASTRRKARHNNDNADKSPHNGHLRGQWHGRCRERWPLLGSMLVVWILGEGGGFRKLGCNLFVAVTQSKYINETETETLNWILSS